MSSYDRVGWREVLGWYSTYRWNAPTGVRCLECARKLLVSLNTGIGPDQLLQQSRNTEQWVVRASVGDCGVEI